jgi:hypothetical protein
MYPYVKETSLNEEKDKMVAAVYVNRSRLLDWLERYPACQQPDEE